MLKKLFKFTFYTALLTIAALIGSVVTINTSLKSTKFRNKLLQTVAASLDGNLSADSLSIGIDRNHLKISGKNLRGTLLDNSLQLEISDSRFRFTFTDLLQGTFFPDTLVLDRARVSYAPAPSDKTDKNFKLATIPATINLLKEFPRQGTSIEVMNGNLNLAGTRLSKLFIKTKPADLGTGIELRGEILLKESPIPFQAAGTVRNSFSKGLSYSFSMGSDSIPLPLIHPSSSFYFSQGTAQLNSTISGSEEEIAIDGTITFLDPGMMVAPGTEDSDSRQEKHYQLKRATLGFQGELRQGRVNLSQLNLQGDGFQLQGSFLFDRSSGVSPFMDLHLKSGIMETATLKMLLPDPYINDWTTQTIFPMLQNGTAEVIDFRLAGSLQEIGNLVRYSHCLSWDGVLRNIDTSYTTQDTVKELGRVHTAALSMRGNVLDIKDISGKRAGSTLSNGRVKISGVYTSPAELTTDIQGSFAMDWLRQLIKDGLMGDTMREQLQPLVNLSGQLSGKVRLNLDLGEKTTLQGVHGKGIIALVKIAHTAMIFPIRVQRGEFTLVYPGNSVIKGDGSWGKSLFNGSLKVVELFREQQFSLNIQPDLAQLKDKLTDDKLLRSLAPCIVTLPIQAGITLRDHTVSSSGSLDFTRLKIREGDPLCRQITDASSLSKAEWRAVISKGKLNVQKLAFFASKGSISSAFTLKKPPVQKLTRLNLRAVDFPLSSMGLILPEYEQWLSGKVNGTLSSKDLQLDTLWQNIDANFNWQWHGEIDWPPLSVINMNIDGQLKDGALQLQGRDVRLKDFNPEYPLTFQADLHINPLWKGTIWLHSKFFDLSSSPSLFREGTTSLKSSLPIDTINIFARCDYLRYQKLLFEPLLLQVHADADTIYIKQGLLEQARDFIWLTGRPARDSIVYHSYFKLTRQPVASLMAMMGFSNDIISGKLDMEGKLTARVSSGDTIFSRTNGPISFEVTDGTLESFSTLIQILDMISLQNIFESQQILQWKNRFHFHKIQGKLTLDHGIFKSDSLVMNAPAFDCFVQGKIDLIRNTVQAQVKLTPFGTISKIVKAIPYIGYVLTGKSGGLFDYSFSVLGELASPEVEYTPLVHTIDSLTGYVKRLVQGREEVAETVNEQMAEDLQEKEAFIRKMKREKLKVKSGH